MTVSSVLRAWAPRFTACIAPSILCLTAISGAAAQAPPDDSTTYDFHRHYKDHEVERYKAEETVTTNGPQTGGKDQSVKYSFIIRETATTDAATGTITFVAQYEKAVASVNGETLDVTAKMPTETMVRDRGGNVHATVQGGTDKLAKLLVTIVATISKATVAALSDKPVKIGDTWNLQPPTPADPNLTWTGKAGLISLQDFNGDKAAKINYATDTSTSGASPSQTHTDASVFIDVQSGKTHELDYKTVALTDQITTTVEIHYNNIDPRPALIALKRAFKAGDVDRYMLFSVTTTKLPDGADHVVKLEMIVRETVKEAGEDGSATLVDEFERARRLVDNGEVADITAQMPRVTQIRSSKGGFQVKTEGGDAQIRSAVLQMVMQTIQAQTDVTPPEPMRVGDSWKFNGTPRENVTRTGKTTVDSLDTVNGAKRIKLSCVTDTAGDGPPAAKDHSEATSLVDVATGKTISMSVRLTSSSGDDKTSTEITYSPVEEASTDANSGK